MIGRVLSFLPNKIPAMTQSRAFAKSSSRMRRSERPKMVSSGILKRCDKDILLEIGVVIANLIRQSVICQEMGQPSDTVYE